ncbi:intermembrane phospholipid transport protein YdbH family protein [Oleiharenicola lentus]|uniref:intermembrane phospholipid transport protein YdbH family protein n=1 Tax=Oleiharenicola lentus TaxID=2508720 RepID=UPI003F67F15B
MNLTQSKRRLLYGCLALVIAVPCAAYLGRVALAGWAFRGALEMVGADAIKFRVASASPWRFVVEDLKFNVRTQAFAAERVAIERTNWWQPSLGVLRVENAKVPLVIDGSDTNPWQWASYGGGDVNVDSLKVPLQEISVDGQLVIQAATLEAEPIAVKFNARQGAGGLWTADVHATGEGLVVKAEGTVDQSTFEVNFKAPEIAVDLKVWQTFIQRMVLLPGGPWEMDGKLTASAQGRVKGSEIKTQGEVHIRDGRAKDGVGRVDASGIEVDLALNDIWEIKTQPGSLRVKEVRSGKLALRDANVEFAFDGAEKISVTKASLQTLGGSVAAEPFRYFPNLRELEVTVSVDGISVEEVMALTEDLPAQASGRVSGSLPLRVDASGVRLGTGWLELKKDAPAEVRFNAKGLLTSGTSKNSPSYSVLNKIESGLLRLRLSELRLDIRPPNSPPGRSAQLRIKGEPVDPSVKAPVSLDLNVNGPIESLLNLGLNTQFGLGTKP